MVKIRGVAAIGDWDEGTLRRFIEDAVDGHPAMAALRRLQGALGNARVSWGLISSAGVIFAGSGDYTIAHPSTSNYTITWTKARNGASYAVLVNPAGTGAINGNPVTIAAATVTVVTYASSTGANLDTAWSFIAIDAQ